MGFRENLAKNLSWSEPAFVKRTLRGCRPIPLWFHIIPIALFSLMVYIGLFVRNVPGDPWWSPYAMGLIIAAISYLIPLTNGLAGATVYIGPTGLSRLDHPIVMQMPLLMLLGVGVTEIKWTKVHACLLVDDQIANRPLRVLELYDQSNDTPLIRIGLGPKKPTTEKLRDCLARNGQELRVIISTPEPAQTSTPGAFHP